MRKGKWDHLALWAFGVAIGAAPLANAGEGEELASARRALEEGIAQVTVVKTGQLLAHLPEEAPRGEVFALRAAAFLALGEPESARRYLPHLSEPLLRGRLHTALGEMEEALAAFDEAEGIEATFGAVEALVALGRASEAATRLEGEKNEPTIRLRLAELYLDLNETPKSKALLERFRPANAREEQWELYLDARQLLAEGHPAYALDRFERLLHSRQPEARPWQIAALLGMSMAHEALEQPDLADDLLESFLWQHPHVPELPTLFRRLDELYARQDAPPLSPLNQMSRREPKGRAGYALYYLAKGYTREGRPDRALLHLAEVAQRFPGHPMLAEALLLKGELLTQRGDVEEAKATLEAAMRAARRDLLRAEIEMASARVAFQEGEYLLAATLYRAAGERAPEIRQRAIFNAALSWLHQGNDALFLETYRELSELYPESPYRQALILEEGLLQARLGQPRAAATLQRFLRDFPGNPRAADALLALAELSYGAEDRANASRYLLAVNQTPTPSDATRQQADYLAIFVADREHRHDPAQVIPLCRSYLSTYPNSPRKGEVRMKLGELLTRQGDFAGAQTEFETLARDEPLSPLASTALFLAGQSAMKSMDAGGIDRALVLFEEVAKGGGPLHLQARLEQAAAQTLLERPQEAILLYDTVLEASPPPEIAFAALAGKAENLLLLGRDDLSAIEQALALYDRLASEASGHTLWRNQALYQKARLLERLERPREALTAYYEALEKGAQQPEEYFWFYKAGFDAARLCEGEKQWESAIAIYNRIAAIDGPRSKEAQARVSQLRLEHFIWE